MLSGDYPTPCCPLFSLEWAGWGRGYSGPDTGFWLWFKMTGQILGYLVAFYSQQLFFWSQMAIGHFSLLLLISAISMGYCFQLRITLLMSMGHSNFVWANVPISHPKMTSSSNALLLNSVTASDANYSSYYRSQTLTALNGQYFQSSVQFQYLKQLEHLHSENTLCHPMITHTIDSYPIPSHNKTK